MTRTAAALGLAAALAAILVPASVGALEPKSELRPDFRRASCGSAFEIDALQGPIGAERGPEPWAVALRRLFETKPQYIFGERGPWRLLARSKRDVLFASRDLPRIGTAELHRSRSGRWEYDGSSSGCVPVVTRRGIEASSWRLDLSYPPPEATDTSLQTLVTESA